MSGTGEILMRIGARWTIRCFLTKKIAELKNTCTKIDCDDVNVLKDILYSEYNYSLWFAKGSKKRMQVLFTCMLLKKKISECERDNSKPVIPKENTVNVKKHREFVKFYESS
jgi:hypothetical protein